MIDLHTHILPGVDDGAEDETEALKMAIEAKKQGITHIVATPHYLEEGFQLTPEATRSKVNLLQKQVDEANLDLKILTGAEVFITPDLGQKIVEGKITTINSSHYILLEFPLEYIPDYVNEVFYDLEVLGYIPIICHPERYHAIIERPEYLYEWVNQGIYAQINASSLVGVFGDEVKRTALKLVENNLVQFIASDVHSVNKRRQYLQKGYQIIKDLKGNQVKYYKKNAKNVINDKEIDILNPQYPEKETLKSKIKAFISKSIF